MTDSTNVQPHQNPILRMLAAFFPFLFRSRHHLNEAEREQSFLLQVVQPALVGLMDGSVSTLAPIFATAYATSRPRTTFLVGVAAAVGAGISMAFAEGLSDDGELTGRGHPIQRGVITGGATFLGGILHTIPFLISDIHVALIVAYVVVAFELAAISLIRFRFFKMPIAKSTIQVVVGGALVFIAGILIGSA
jgi:VIT1/CCC1 family predicted Fe2+/Mn2+ transporter